MEAKMSRKPVPRGCRRIVFAVLGILSLCLIAGGVLALSNRGLPARSQIIDRLGEVEKARLAEAVHLRQALGDRIWPAWSEADIPLIVHNEAYAFLIGYPHPPDGWTMMPSGERRGGPWEEVPGDRFEGQAYYRQKLSDPEKTPENFTVRVGELWAATLFTKEYAEVDFYRGFREELPPFLVGVFPYRLAWGAIMGETETYIGALNHEAFHALQGTLAPERLAEAETVNRLEARYPFEEADLDERWKEEMAQLIASAQAQTDGEARDLARRFLEERAARRSELRLAADLVDYERQREWLEGLAKHAELALTRLAGSDPDYLALPGVGQDPGFKEYANRERFWKQQLTEAGHTAGRSGETRFYYSGHLQAVVLDRLLPGWKAQAFNGEVFLEELLREAVR
jgi:hypothetical protein